VFAGDSHVRKFNLEQYFISPKYTLLNRGIKSDTTTGLLSRFKETINNIKTDKLVLIIGYNDLKYRDNSKIIYNYDKILTTATAKTVYVFSVFPVGKNRTWFNSRIIELNRGIKKLCVKYNIIYVDMFPYLVYPDGGLKDEYSLDGTHLNTTGYNVLASVLNKLLFNHND
jgi:lysophospholipase L1-like esterase